jgi:antitoxin MazE
LKIRDGLSAVVGKNRAIEVDTKEDQRRRALDRMAALNWALPPDYKFDRDEANER